LKIKVYGGFDITDVGSIDLMCEANKEKYSTRFIIVDDSKTRCVPILGLNTSIMLGLINKSLIIIKIALIKI